MKTFLEIRESLKKLPDLRKGRAFEEKYAQYLKIIVKAKDELSKASVALPHADAVAPAPEYAEVRKSISKASKNAKQIAEKLKAQPEAIDEKATDKIITSLKENAAASLSQCKKVWETRFLPLPPRMQIVLALAARRQRARTGRPCGLPPEVLVRMGRL